jgi:UPF0271 protein
MILCADVGETFEDKSVGFDSEVIPFVDIANIACGGHGGTYESITTAIELTRENGVKIAAHPSYVDPEHFGRRSIDIESKVLKKQLKDQFSYLCDLTGEEPKLIKAHGALYNDMFSSRKIAQTFLEAFEEVADETTFIGAPRSSLEVLCAENNVQFMKEGFSDRRYLDDGSLAPRSRVGSLLIDIEEILEQVQSIANSSTVIAASGNAVSLFVDVICFHGDHRPSIEALAKLFEMRSEFQ